MHSSPTRAPIAAVLLLTFLVSWSAPAFALRQVGLEESNQRSVVASRLGTPVEVVSDLPQTAGLEENKFSSCAQMGADYKKHLASSKKWTAHSSYGDSLWHLWAAVDAVIRPLHPPAAEWVKKEDPSHLKMAKLLQELIGEQKQEGLLAEVYRAHYASVGKTVGVQTTHPVTEQWLLKQSVAAWVDPFGIPLTREQVGKLARHEVPGREIAFVIFAPDEAIVFETAPSLIRRAASGWSLPTHRRLAEHLISLGAKVHNDSEAHRPVFTLQRDAAEAARKQQPKTPASTSPDPTAAQPLYSESIRWHLMAVTNPFSSERALRRYVGDLRGFLTFLLTQAKSNPEIQERLFVGEKGRGNLIAGFVGQISQDQNALGGFPVWDLVEFVLYRLLDENETDPDKLAADLWKTLHPDETTAGVSTATKPVAAAAVKSTPMVVQRPPYPASRPSLTASMPKEPESPNDLRKELYPDKPTVERQLTPERLNGDLWKVLYRLSNRRGRWSERALLQFLRDQFNRTESQAQNDLEHADKLTPDYPFDAADDVFALMAEVINAQRRPEPNVPLVYQVVKRVDKEGTMHRPDSTLTVLAQAVEAIAKRIDAREAYATIKNAVFGTYKRSDAGLEENLDRIKPIEDVAGRLGIPPEELVPYGKFMAKVNAPELMRRLAQRPSGKLVIVTGMTPTPAGEGKTTTAIGLLDGLAAIGVPAVADLREPAQGPVFGAKGTATGTGRAQLYPAKKINLAFTGDFAAIAQANNYLVAAFKNALYWKTLPGEWDTQTILPHAMDLNARDLRDQFILTPASEVMAIVALAKDSEDLRRRLGRMIVAWRTDGTPVTAQHIDAVDNMMSLLEDAMMPNLVQTLEGNPVFVHAGPFANIAHGTSSVIATELSQKLVGPEGLVIQETGFGSELGFEKFADMVAQQTGITPAAAVLVVSARALKWHGGVQKENDLTQPNPEALQRGLANLDEHLRIIRTFGVPVVVAINQFSQDVPEELAAIQAHLEATKVPAAVYNAVAQGSDGSRRLARVLLDAVKNQPGKFRPLYSLNQPFETKLELLAGLYGASGVDYSPQARRHLERITRADAGYEKLPVIVAKTPASLSDNPELRGVPSGWRLNVQKVSVSAGAGFLRVEVGEKPPLLMPGLPKQPRKLSGLEEKENVSIPPTLAADQIKPPVAAERPSPAGFENPAQALEALRLTTYLTPRQIQTARWAESQPFSDLKRGGVVILLADPVVMSWVETDVGQKDQMAWLQRVADWNALKTAPGSAALAQADSLSLAREAFTGRAQIYISPTGLEEGLQKILLIAKRQEQLDAARAAIAEIRPGLEVVPYLVGGAVAFPDFLEQHRQGVSAAFVVRMSGTYPESEHSPEEQIFQQLSSMHMKVGSIDEISLSRVRQVLSRMERTLQPHRDSAGLEEGVQGPVEEFIRRYAAIQRVAQDKQRRGEKIQELVAVSQRVSLAGRIQMDQAGHVYLSLPPPAEAVHGARATQVLYDDATGELYIYSEWGSGRDRNSGLTPVFSSRRVNVLTPNAVFCSSIESEHMVLLVPQNGANGNAGLEEKLGDPLAGAVLQGSGISSWLGKNGFGTDGSEVRFFRKPSDPDPIVLARGASTANRSMLEVRLAQVTNDYYANDKWFRVSVYETEPSAASPDVKRVAVIRPNGSDDASAVEAPADAVIKEVQARYGNADYAVGDRLGGNNLGPAGLVNAAGQVETRIASPGVNWRQLPDIQELLGHPSPEDLEKRIQELIPTPQHQLTAEQRATARRIADRIMQETIRRIVTLVRRSGLPPNRLRLVHGSVPGPVKDGRLGVPFALSNVPGFEDYPWADEIQKGIQKELGISVPAVAENDTPSGFKGETAPSGTAAGFKRVIYGIWGTGMNDDTDQKSTKPDTIPMFETGHALVGKSDGQGTFHYELRDATKSRPVLDNGEYEVEQRLGGEVLKANFRRAGFKDETEVTAAAQSESHPLHNLALALIGEIGAEYGRSRATLLAHYYLQEGFVPDRYVIGSGVAEGLGKGVLNEVGEDLLFASIRKAAEHELMSQFGVDSGVAQQIANTIVRSTMDANREIAAAAYYLASSGLEEDEAVLQHALGDPEKQVALESAGSVTLQEVGGESVTVTAVKPHTASFSLYLQDGLQEPAGLPATVSVKRLAANLPGVLDRWQAEPPSPQSVIVWNAGVVDEVTVMAWMPLVNPSPAALRMTAEASHEITANIINTLAEMARKQGKILEIRSITYLQVGSGTYAIIRAA